MSTIYVAYFLAISVGIVITAGLGIYAWRRRASVAGAGVFAVIAGIVSFILIDFLGMGLGQTPDLIFFFVRLRFFGQAVLPVLVFLTVLKYVGQEHWLRPIVRIALFVIPALIQILVWTDSQFHLFYQSWNYTQISIFSIETPQYAIGFWIHIGYGYSLVLIALVLLLVNALRNRGPFREQATIMLLSYLCILIFNVPGFISVMMSPFPNLSPLGYIPCAVVFAVALFRYEMLVITPIANDRVVASMFDGVIVADLNRRVVGFNPSSESIFQKKYEQVIGKKLDTLFPAMPNLPNISTTGTETVQEIGLGNPLRSYELKTAPIYRRNAILAGHLIVLRDITEQKIAHEHAIDLASERQKMEILTNFVRNSSHDLLTPLTVMSTNVYLLRQPLSEEMKQQRLDTLNQNISRLITIIEDLHQMSMLDGGMRIVPAPLNLNRIEYYVPDSFRTKMSILKQTLVWQLFSAPLIISGDEGLIVKAFHNLLHNAILYTPPGGHITICTGRLNNQVVYLKISDDGIGMEQEQLPHIFERFYKINQARTTNGSGAGLGLTIVKKIVDMHHGRVVVDSTPGNGSTFSLHFPNHEAILAPAIVDNYL